MGLLHHFFFYGNAQAFVDGVVHLPEAYDRCQFDDFFRA